jgi:hypothetical protein
MDRHQNILTLSGNVRMQLIGTKKS